MDEEIQFGEIEHAAPRRALRPDENRHFTVAAYGEPKEGDLPIYVDLDVMRDMEDHALSDTSVELGGVLLGGQYEDEEGRAFVVVTDSLRAQHFESTKGSFKFTHDTWSAISREREAFPAELQMVGWYHTHPDWGVFLSGMDMFICDNFFNKQLDVAYVIDPCRGDRGMFQWTGDERQRVRRTGGFFVTASRFRAAELEYYVAEISGAMPATSTIRSGGAPGAPIVHLHQPQEAQPSWQGIAVCGMLGLQFLLVALIAWRMLTPSVASSGANDDKLAAAVAKLDATLGSIETRRQVELAKERVSAHGELLDQIVRDLKGTDDGFVTRLQERFDQTSKLTDDITARDARIKELAALAEEHRSRLLALEATSSREQERLKSQLTSLSTENERLQDDLQKNKRDLSALKTKLNPTTAEVSAKSQRSMWWWAGGAALLAIVVVGSIWWIGGSREAEQPESTEPKDQGIEVPKT